MLSLASKLAALCSGGTDCHTALEAANARYRDNPYAAVIYISDNASWVTPHAATYGYGALYHGVPMQATTALMAEWKKFTENQRRIGRFPAPKLICWDLAHYGSAQAPEEGRVYNVGGFSDAVFGLISSIVEDDRMRFVRMVEETAVL